MPDQSTELEAKLAGLQKQLRRQRVAIVTLTLSGAGLLTAGFAQPVPDTLTVKGIRVVDGEGRPRILIGAPPPIEGRVRTDAQTASLVVLGPDGRDRVILGESPNPHLGGKTYPRIDAAYGMVIHDQAGSERGAMAFLDNGRGVVTLDRPGGDAVAMLVNDRTGFAGVTVNYANPIGQYAEGVRLGTRDDTAWLAMGDRSETERARLAVEGAAAPNLKTSPSSPVRP